MIRLKTDLAARLAIVAAVSSMAAACVSPATSPTPPVVMAPPPAAAPAPAVPISAFTAGIALGPALSFAEPDAAAALASFVESCPSATSRGDTSGLTIAADWVAPCDAARGWPAGAARQFFDQYFTPVRVGAGEAFATGYFEPEIAGSREQRPGYHPVYGLPPDLERGWPEDVPLAERTGRPPLGRATEDGRFVRYFERGEIEDGALDGRAPVIAWVADPIEFFFLQIQGSGRLLAPDGDVIRIGYAGQNGREYLSLGAAMREAGLIGDAPGQYEPSMQGIVRYLRENPVEGRALMRRNKSWVFFRELMGDGPLGSIGVPVRAGSSVAVDPRYVPYGAPVWLDLDRNEADGLWIAQDTGGAIKGANRFDTFWGAGEAARATAGTMSARGTAYVLLPKEAAARLTGG